MLARFRRKRGLTLPRFETARAELRAIGISLTMHPGTYAVNFRGASDATAYFSDELVDAIDHGRAMAATRRAQEAADQAIVAATGKPRAPRVKRRRKMTPKAMRRRMIRQHNRRLRAGAQGAARGRLVPKRRVFGTAARKLFPESDERCKTDVAQLRRVVVYDAGEHYSVCPRPAGYRCVRSILCIELLAN